ncbi:MAG: ATP-dependent zinc metalloprotease FtsH [Gammaproteobacteria bacterium]|nr:ATP-dependent zinc metalloprotease FtsH [Gammaproteobacteria bacterium]
MSIIARLFFRGCYLFFERSVLKIDFIKNLLLWTVVALILITVFNNFGPRQPAKSELSYSQFVREIKEGNIASVTITDQNIKGLTHSHKSFSTYLPLADQNLLSELFKARVDITGKPPEKPGFLFQMLVSWFPMFLFIGIWIFMLRQQMGAGRGGAFSFGRSRARLLNEGKVKVTFADVAGCDEAKAEVSELVDFLRAPAKFQKLGGRIPRGVLLVGAPGTGKTLLAKAVAGEAKVPFFSISGSDFVEMFVGVGASRVRDMFEQAKKQVPCIIFIDELDAVGRHRGAGLGGGHDEREQTLNQLLVEMDGFEGNEGVIVLSATNRPDVLDPALLRPGRFDRQVVVPLPDIRGREQILQVHLKKVPLAKDVNSSAIARGTPGFSGADLANLVNEAALIAARSNQHHVNMHALESAKDKVLMGAERRSMVMSEEEKQLTAVHEAGHTIVGRTVPEHDPVYKATIIPRGRALGVTMFLPEVDRYNMSKRRLISQITTLFGGRVAEELVFGKDQMTTGASNDIKRATELARNMVTRWGLSEKLGPLTYAEDEGEVFLGQSFVTQRKEVSDHTAQQIDEEIRDIVDRCYKHAQQILAEKRSVLDHMSGALLKYETIDVRQIDDLMDGKPAQPPAEWEKISQTAENASEPAVSKRKTSTPRKKQKDLLEEEK